MTGAGDDAKKAGLISAARALLNLGAEAELELELLAGGATGQTFRLSNKTESTDYVLRTLRPNRADDGHLVRNSQVLADANVSPKVLASSEKMMLTEFVPGKPASVVDLGQDDHPHVTAIAHLAARLHSVDVDSIEGAGADNEFDYWLNILDEVWSEKKIPEPLNSQLHEAVEEAKAYTKNVILNPDDALNKKYPEFYDVLVKKTVTHGDFHPSNILVGETDAVWAVDLERVAPRGAGFDIAYLFMVWGDLRYVAKTWQPSPAEPGPYAELESRRTFATEYLIKRTGGGKKSFDCFEVDEFLYMVERFGYVERVRLFIIWLLLSGGDENFMLVGAAKQFVPAAPHFQKLLLDDAAHKDVIRQGVVVATNARLAAAAAAPQE